MLIVMHYFAGVPFKRVEALHQGWGVPIPDANQWRVVDECDDLLAHLYKALEKHAIQNATTLGFDDTGSMIIETRRQIQQELQVLEAEPACCEESPAPPTTWDSSIERTRPAAPM